MVEREDWKRVYESYHPKKKYYIALVILILMGATFFLFQGIPKPTVLTANGTIMPLPPIYPVQVPVLVLKYFPLDNSGTRLNESITGMNDDLTAMRTKVNRINNELLDALENGSAYHKYKNSSAAISLDYSIYEEKEFLIPIPVIDEYPPSIPKNADKKMIFSDINICNYVDNYSVKEVWVWMYHTSQVSPIESNMAIGNVSRNYWNHDNYGDVSNSYQINDMPVCQKTYTVYEYNYGRGTGEALEDHTHQIESLLNWIDGRDITPANQWQNLLFWGKFVGSDYSSKIINPGCGWAHYPPNALNDYEWNNEITVMSDCENWKPDGTDQKTLVNCETWKDVFIVSNRWCPAGNPSCKCPIDSGAGFKVWWMQNIPGKDNNLTYNGKQLRNWWDFKGDFDSAIAVGKNLTR